MKNDEMSIPAPESASAAKGQESHREARRKAAARERPILMSGPMVRATLEDLKTHTRRVVRVSPAWSHGIIQDQHTGNWQAINQHGDKWDLRCPYGQVGDRLWVRETACYQLCDRKKEKAIAFRADGTELPDSHVWSPAIHMPRWASRITLEIVSVRVERVQEISLDDIQREGVTQELIDALIDPVAARQKVLDDHWVHGADEGENYCHRCCLKKIKALLQKEPAGEFHVDGGWGSEYDSIPLCETCGAILSGTLTDYGAESEIEHFLESGLNLRSPDDCYCLQRALAAGQWDPWPSREKLQGYEQERDIEKVLNARRLGWRILWDSINAKLGFRWAVNPWVWVIEFRRIQP